MENDQDITAAAEHYQRVLEDAKQALEKMLALNSRISGG